MSSKFKNRFRLNVLLLFFLAPFLTVGQSSVKINATTLIGIPNIGFETTLGKHTTFQVDAAATFGTTRDLPFKTSDFIINTFIEIFKPIDARKYDPNYGPYKFLMLIPELRYYAKEDKTGFYIGAHIGGGVFKLQKWNHPTEYHEGYNMLFGGTLGYQFYLTERLNLDLFFGGGVQSAAYKAYSLKTGLRTDGPEGKNYDKSGETIPYRGGLMLVYKFKKSEKNIQE